MGQAMPVHLAPLLGKAAHDRTRPLLARGRCRVMPDTPPAEETFLQRRLRIKAEREQEALFPPRRPASAPAPVVDADNHRARRWCERKLEQVAADLAATTEGSRNHALNAAAYTLGRHVPKWLDEQTVTDTLICAAAQAGLGYQEAAQTIRSGLTSGMDDPRDPPIDPNSNGSSLAALVAGEVRTTAAHNGAPHPAAEPPAPVDPEAEDAALRLLIRQNLKPLDWHELWADDSEEEWIVEPILPARRLVALYSAPKVGKSLLMLELAVAVVRGVPVLGVTPDRPRRVLYVDFENDPKADVRERLQAMGVGPDDLTGLIYLSYPTLAALDSDRGGKELLAAVAEYGCEVVVVDTVSRSIAGEENENDTWLSFYRHTGLRLKQSGVALIRLDHSGKDESKGQRGGSAKSGDVDAVWRMSRLDDDKYRLDCEAARMPVTERTLVLHRKQGPLRHIVDAEGRSAVKRLKVEAAINALDEAGAPRDISQSKARELLRQKGLKIRNDALGEAVKRRQIAVPVAWGQVPENDLSPSPRGQVGTGGAA